MALDDSRDLAYYDLTAATVGAAEVVVSLDVVR